MMGIEEEEDEEESVSGRHRPDKVSVSVRVIFTKIGTIDTIHDRYSADVTVLSKWREPALDDKKTQTSDQIDWDRYWDPRLSIANGIGDVKYVVGHSLHRNAVGAAVVCEHRHCQGQFFEFMELNKFPFDSQDLTIHVTTDRTADELEFIADETDVSGVNTGAFSAEQEWRLDDRVNVWKKMTTKRRTAGEAEEGKTTKIPSIYVAAKASRRPQFFIYNIIIIMFSISSMAFATFTVKLETPESRLPLTFILVLTTVTFKFVVNKSLPKISYLTYLDKYILGSMIILCMVCVWHAVAGSVVCSSTASTTTPNPATAIPSESADATHFTIYWNYSTTAAHSASSSSSSCPKKDKCVASSTAVAIDYIALGVLGTIYIGFHVVFMVLINCHGTDDGPNEEIDLGDEEEDDIWKEGKQEEEVKEEEEEERVGGRHRHHHHHANGVREKALKGFEDKVTEGKNASIVSSPDRDPREKNPSGAPAVDAAAMPSVVD